MDHSFLDKCFQAIRPATWKQVNAALAQAAVAAGVIDPSTIRADTTAVETDRGTSQKSRQATGSRSRIGPASVGRSGQPGRKCRSWLREGLSSSYFPGHLVLVTIPEGTVVDESPGRSLPGAHAINLLFGVACFDADGGSVGHPDLAAA